MIEQLRRLRVRLENAITRAVLDRSDANGRFLQLLWGGDRVSADVEHLEPQGLHVRPPAGASAVLLAPGGSRAGALALGVGADVPADGIEAGEGGLHYLGAYRVFMKANGEVHLAAMIATKSAAVGETVDSEGTAWAQDLNLLKSAIEAALQAVVPAGPASGSVLGSTALIAFQAGFTGPHSPESVCSAKVKIES